MTPKSDTWLIEHMTGQKYILYKLTKKDSPHKLSLGDDYQYPIKGIGEASYKLDSGTPMKMKDILFVPVLKKNLLSISTLDKKGFRVSFIDGEVLMWPRGSSLENAVVIGVEEGGLYKLKGHTEASMLHDITSPCELWHRRLAHLNYKALPQVSKVVSGLPYMKIDHEGVVKDVQRGRISRTRFGRVIPRHKGYWTFSIHMCAVWFNSY